MSQLQSTMASLPLVYNYRAVFEAIDPATGLEVTGVLIVNPSIYGIDLSAGDETPPIVPQESPLLTVAPGQTG